MTNREMLPGYQAPSDDDRKYVGDDDFQFIRFVERKLRERWGFDECVRELREWLAREAKRQKAEVDAAERRWKIEALEWVINHASFAPSSIQDELDRLRPKAKEER